MKAQIEYGTDTGETEPAGERKPHIVVLSSSLLEDRMFRYTECLPLLTQAADVSLWATSARDPGNMESWKDVAAGVEPFPEILPFREYYNYLRRLNEYAWDFRYKPPSRLSIMRHLRDKQQRALVRSLKAPARVFAALGAEGYLENWLERRLLAYPRSPETARRFERKRPDLLVTTSPFQFEQPAVVAAARQSGIPVMAMIPSWDNISTKNRMVYKYDAYVVWSEQTKEELIEAYPSAAGVPIYVVGAPQFDIFFQKRFHRSRSEFCMSQGLRPDLPIIVYAVGSPNLIRGEKYGALDLAERVDSGRLGDVQLIVRPHPLHDNSEMAELFGRFSGRIVLQKTAQRGTPLKMRYQGEMNIVEWVNTFRHADVVVNLSSTVTVDAAIFDKPVVNVDYDSEPGQIQQNLIKEVNHLWTHFKPIAESGGVWNVENHDEAAHAVSEYLRDPSLHRERRGWIVKRVCEYVDGQCGLRMGRAILDFAATVRKRG